MKTVLSLLLPSPLVSSWLWGNPCPDGKEDDGAKEAKQIQCQELAPL